MSKRWSIGPLFVRYEAILYEFRSSRGFEGHDRCLCSDTVSSVSTHGGTADPGATGHITSVVFLQDYPRFP